MGQRAGIAGSDLPAVLSFPNQLGHQRHGLPIESVDVIGEGGEHWTEDGRSSLDLPDERAEGLSSAEICGRGVDDEMEALQRSALACRGRLHFAEVFAGATIERLGDQVLLAVEELVDGG